jgi:hypothetical protein
MNPLSLITNPTKTVSISLLVAVVALGAMYGWERLEVGRLESELVVKEVEIERAELNIEKISDAQKSCKTAMTKLIKANQKKHSVIKQYEKLYHKGEDDAINNLDDFIDFANRLQ